MGRLDEGAIASDLLEIAARLQRISADIIAASDGHEGALWQVAGLGNAAMHIGATIRRLSMSLDEAQADYVRTTGDEVQP